MFLLAWSKYPRNRTTGRQSLGLLSTLLLSSILILTSCERPSNTAQGFKSSTPGISQPQPTPTPDPFDWVWQMRIPENRLLVYYYIPGAPWGFLGSYNDEGVLKQARKQSEEYQMLDPAHPVISALDIASPVVIAEPGPQGYYSAFSSPQLIQHYLDLATKNHMLFFFDMQIGRAPLLKEMETIWPYLEQPNVELALDPEFALDSHGIPDVNLGHMTAAQINPVIDGLARLVKENELPPKMLIIHQWQESMLPDWYNIQPKYGVQVITCSDGFGSPGQKIADYRIFDDQRLIQYPGFKLFYPNFPGAAPHHTLDEPFMSAQDVLKLDPVPVMVMYQ
jgi:hypothetical protein